MAKSVLIVPVPAADPVVDAYRKKYDTVSLHGIPAHVTLLFPFKDPSKITGETERKIEQVFLNVKPFPFMLANINTFPNVIFLEPDPREPFIELTERVAKAFPEHPPWEGKYQAINPHLTIGASIETQQMKRLQKQIMEDIGSKLPIKATATEAWLMVKNTDAWTIKRKFKFRK